MSIDLAGSSNLIPLIRETLKNNASLAHHGIVAMASEILTQQKNETDPNRQLALQALYGYVDRISCSRFQKFAYYITGNSKAWEDCLKLKAALAPQILNPEDKSGIKIIDIDTSKIDNGQHAFEHFILEFNEVFPSAQLKPMSEPEKKLMDQITDRIWKSANVQECPPQERYVAFRDLMKQFYSGAHLVFEEQEADSFLKQLQEKVGFTPDKHNLGDKMLAGRVSTHYVKKVGEQDHVHLAGRQIPETVFSEVLLPVKDGSVIPGIRADMYQEQHPKESIKTKKVFWIQTENHPDGPDWRSFLLHRTFDFLNYMFRKMFYPKQANVGPFGYGPGDKHPIIIRLTA